MKESVRQKYVGEAGGEIVNKRWGVRWRAETDSEADRQKSKAGKEKQKKIKRYCYREMERQIPERKKVRRARNNVPETEAERD